MKLIRLCVLLVFAYTYVSAKDVTKHEPLEHPKGKGLSEAKLPAGAGPLACTGSVTAYSNGDNQGAVTLTVSGGTPPYTIAWDGYKVPSNTDYYNLVQSAGIYTTIDVTRLNAQVDSLRSLTNKRFLTPNVHFARIYSTAGDSMNIAAVVTNTLSWANLSGITPASTTTTAKTLNGRVYMPRAALRLTKSATAGVTNNYAISNNIFYRSDYNFIQCEISDATNQIYLGLNSYGFNPVAGIPDMSYYFQFNAKTATYYNGATTGGTVAYDVGDVFSIKTYDGTVYYYKNDVQLASYTMGSTPFYQLKVVMNQQSASIGGIGVINGGMLGPAPISYTGNLYATPTDVACGSPCSGKITASAFIASTSIITAQNFQLFASSDLVNPVATYTISSSTFSVEIAGLCAGDYYVKYNYSDGTARSLGASTTVAYMPDWINQVNVNVDPTLHNMSKSTGADWSAGANSANEVEYSPLTTEFFEFSPSFATGIGGEAVGFSFRNGANYTSVAPADIQFGLYIVCFPVSAVQPPPGASNTLPANGTLYAFDRQNNPVLPTLNTYYSNDRFRITKNGHTFRFYKNSTQLYSTYSISSSPNTSAMVADASLYRNGSQVLRPRISFACPIAPVYALLKRQLDGHYYQMRKDQLYFKYDEEYDDTDGRLFITIYNSANQKVVDGSTIAPGLLPSVSYGDNYYRLDLSNTAYTGGSALAAGYYVLEVTNEKQEKWYLRFKK